jgi:hypothetical protein
MMRDRGLLSSEEYDSLLQVSKGDDAQGDIPQVHWERLVSLGYALRRLGTRQASPRRMQRSTCCFPQRRADVIGRSPLSQCASHFNQSLCK